MQLGVLLSYHSTQHQVVASRIPLEMVGLVLPAIFNALGCIMTYRFP